MIVRESYDFRSNLLGIDIKNSSEHENKDPLRKTKLEIIKSLQYQYGLLNKDQKMQNFQEVGIEPFSVIAYHNKIYRECTSAFIMCHYYPALTGA